jgi:hypothetical protein
MGMTSRGYTAMGGGKAVVNPFVDGSFGVQRIAISVDNAYNRGKIPAFSLWAPSDQSSNPWKYMPYIPQIPLRDVASTTVMDIDNEWVDYFRAGDEVAVLDVSEFASDNLAFIGKVSADETAMTLGTNSCTIASVGVKDSGTNGTGYVKITLTDALFATPAEGALGTGDILVLVGSSTSTAIKAYQEADTVVIMEQEFDFKDAVMGKAAGQGGYLVESCVYRYSGRIDYNYVEGYDYLNINDSSPALTVCGTFTNGLRLDFQNIYRG